MMEVAVDEVVGVLAVRDGLVPTTRAVLMALLGARTSVVRRTAVRVGRAHRDHMFDDLRSFLMVKVSVMQIVLMSVVANRRVPAIRSVLVRVIRMRLEFHMSSGHESTMRQDGSTIDAHARATRKP